MGHGTLLSSGADIDFMIHGIFKYKFFGHEVWITTTHVSVLIVMLILIAFGFIARRTMLKATEVPGTFQNVVEMMVEALNNMVMGTMGKWAGEGAKVKGKAMLALGIIQKAG